MLGGHLPDEGQTMDADRARELLTTSQAEVRRLLGEVGIDEDQDHEAKADNGDIADPAPALDAQAVDEAVAAGLRDKLDAIERALQRLDEGSYGRSVLSGEIIPDARLEADPTAELTVEEASAAER